MNDDSKTVKPDKNRWRNHVGLRRISPTYVLMLLFLAMSFLPGRVQAQTYVVGNVGYIGGYQLFGAWPTYEEAANALVAGANAAFGNSEAVGTCVPSGAATSVLGVCSMIANGHEYCADHVYGYTCILAMPIRVYFFVWAKPPPPCNFCDNNSVPDPISPTTGAMFDSFNDTSSASGAVRFKRFYNSIDNGVADVSVGWRHSYGRSAVTRYSTIDTHKYLQSPDYSSQYADAATACTGGFPEIQPGVASWAGAVASYVNGNCLLTKNGVSIGSIAVYSTAGSNLNPAPTPVAYDLTRDDGQLIRFVINGTGAIITPPGINLKLQVNATGFTVTDSNDSVEQYDTNGKLLSITSRVGVVQTMSYDTSGRLSEATDSFGHQLTLSYDAQNHLISVTRQ